MRVLLTMCVCCMVVGGLMAVNAQEAAWGTMTQWLAPIWEGDTMHGESVLFVQETPETRPKAALLFPAETIISVIQTYTGMQYVEGKDFALTEDKTGLVLPEGSRILSRTREELYPPKDSPNSYPAKRDSDRHMLFGEGHYFHDQQVEVTYTHKAGLWQERGAYVPAAATNELVKTRAKLSAREPVTVILLGDSISAGGNATGMNGAAPFVPSFGWLVAHGLRAQYGTPVTFKNFAVGGKATPWGIEVAPEIAKEKPDLAIIAFGMNDASGRLDTPVYLANTKTIMDSFRATNPDTEFILVATMTGNPEWTASSYEHYEAYREGLKTLAGPGVAVADMTSMWEELLKHKEYVSFTGNGVNHPNDMGHRLYAQVILALLH
ncbi:MAG: SGNH/GDSL hydrolase family protein [Candidatus Hydrogenedentes bacterium]|nr:SGNH/GDSL hydrolase family protein [Candidatus Hydrogenedentota bacterium]